MNNVIMDVYGRIIVFVFIFFDCFVVLFMYNVVKFYDICKDLDNCIKIFVYK